MDATGVTERVAGLAATPLWTKPSFQVTVHGATPVRAAWIVVELPAQIDALPVTDAVAAGVTETVAEPALLQPPTVTVTPSWTGDVTPAEKTIAFVPAPDVIVPFVIVPGVRGAPARGRHRGDEAARVLARGGGSGGRRSRRERASP